MTKMTKMTKIWLKANDLAQHDPASIPKDVQFLKELSALCQKYEANFQTESLEFKNGVKYVWVEVHGQWPVHDDALRAEKVVSDAVVERITLPGSLNKCLRSCI